MAAVAMFDTLVYSKKLQAAGVPVEIAEVHAFTLNEIVHERLAKIEDVQELESAFEARMDKLEARMEKLEERMAKLEERMDKLEERMDKFEARMDKLEKRIDKLEYKIEKLSFQLTIRLGGLMAAGIVLIPTMQKLLA